MSSTLYTYLKSRSYQRIGRRNTHSFCYRLLTSSARDINSAAQASPDFLRKGEEENKIRFCSLKIQDNQQLLRSEWDESKECDTKALVVWLPFEGQLQARTELNTNLSSLTITDEKLRGKVQKSCQLLFGYFCLLECKRLQFDKAILVNCPQ